MEPLENDCCIRQCQGNALSYQLWVCIAALLWLEVEKRSSLFRVLYLIQSKYLASHRCYQSYCESQFLDEMLESNLSALKSCVLKLDSAS